MRKIVLLLVTAVMISAIEAKSKKDPVIMTVAGKDILLSEFLFIAKRDNKVDFNNKKSVDEYVELYKNFKLKVADAEASSIHELERFEQEFENAKRLRAWKSQQCHSPCGQ